VTAAVTGVAWLGLHQLTGTSGDGPLTVAGRPVSTVEPMLVSRTRTIVQPGDTLWSIARRVQRTGDIRPLVDAMASSRHGRALQVGETIEVPGR
jgi:nucleoid-associated protein YgaU